MTERLVERDTELRQLDLTLSGLADGGQFVVVAAPSGMGATSLLDEVAKRAQQRSMTVLRATGSSAEQDYPFGVVLQLFDDLRSCPAHLELAFSGRGHLAKPLLEDVIPTCDPIAEFAVIQGLYWCLANLAETTQQLVIVDDAQWSDVESLRCLTYLATRLSDLPIAVVVAISSGYVSTGDHPIRQLMSVEEAISIDLQPLSSSGVAAVFRAAGVPATPAESTPLDRQRCRRTGPTLGPQRPLPHRSWCRSRSRTCP